jgi:DNA-directed RNA polymerase subunit RPC12/RpoP
MASSCPDCGSAVEYTDREVRLRTGTCAACGHEFTFVVGTAIEIGEVPGPSEAVASGEAATSAVPGPECADCGTTLVFRARPDGSLEASCEECESTTLFVPSSPGAERGSPGFPTEERRPSRGRPPREDRDSSMGPRGRPCRQCGAPLRFTTNDEGSLVGECDSCGNKFILPPREFSGGRGRPSDRGPSRSGGGRYGPPRGRPSYNRGPGGYNRRPRPYGRDRGDSDDDDGDKRRRRRRDSE